MNQNYKQHTRDSINSMLEASRCLQSKNNSYLAASNSMAIRKYSTKTGPVNYVLSENDCPVSLVEVNRKEDVFGNRWKQKQPIEFFDSIIVDECHQDIYNLWKQVLDYFDAFQIGLTTTPDNHTFGYFDRNIVSDYGYKKAVEDGVLVPYNVFEIETKITKGGSKISIDEYIGQREKLARKEFWNKLDEDVEYSRKNMAEKV